MGTPSWLYYLFALAMLVVAAYSVNLLVLSFRPSDPSGRDVDVGHVFMGVAMAGMFVPDWAFWPSRFWEVSFFVLFVWFFARSVISIQRFGLHIPHQAIHALMSVIMLTMYRYPMRASVSSSMTMGTSSSHGTLDPGVSVLLAFVLCASAIFTLASKNKGASHHGSHRRVRQVAYVGTGVGLVRDDTTSAPGNESPGGVGVLLQNPQLEDVSHAVMCVGMAFMLILMT